ncbi:(2Fe-2S)-binding protein [Rhodoligotrophos defluvii]|uniref:(2Fe-2S)-binding protein n=1 Tax=Rhodoligotrophos defluvii TaxID=2561934 RepID=UPI001EF14551|nr:(2Fe-2S)-binding protein [Rhodoligotrophos defluvii]
MSDSGWYMRFSIRVNGTVHRVEAEPDTPLLWILRDVLGLTGTKYGCGTGDCGACTVLVGSRPRRSCQLRIARLGHASIVTIEGISGAVADGVLKAWREADLSECGYCQSGQIITAIALLTTNVQPSDREIDQAFDGSICRCTAYLGIRRAVHHAANIIKR